MNGGEKLAYIDKHHVNQKVCCRFGERNDGQDRTEGQYLIYGLVEFMRHIGIGVLHGTS